MLDRSERWPGAQCRRRQARGVPERDAAEAADAASVTHQNELALRRIGVDAETVLQIREEFGELTEAERAAIKEALRRVREGETA